MALIKKKELKSLDEAKREQKLQEYGLELAKEKANREIGSSISSPGRIREMRKTVARIKTMQRIQKKGVKSG